MKEYSEFYNRATAIVAQIKEMSLMLESNNDLREYVNIYMDSSYAAEDDPLIITVDFIYDRLFRPLLER